MSKPSIPHTIFEDSFSEEIWKTTYKDHKDDTADDTLRRVATAVASVESTDELKEEWGNNFYDMLSEFKCTTGGRIYSNAGTEWNGTTLMNCFVSPRDKFDIDSLDGILKDVRNQCQTLKSEGGWGQNFSYIRPRGSFINGIGVESPGAVKYMEIFDKTSDVITSGSGKKSEHKKAKGKIRKGAMMGVMDVWHPDIIEFITAKQQPGRLTKFNISVNCTNEFMEKVLRVIEIDNELAKLETENSDASIYIAQLYEEREKADKWVLRYPKTTHPEYKKEWQGDLKKWEEKGYPIDTFRTVSTLWLWNLIMESTYNRAEPGVLFLDRANHFGPLNYLETIYATNPCGEQTLAPGGVCNLGSINLTQFINEERIGFDIAKIRKYTRYLNRFLDNVNSLSHAPLPEYEDSMKHKRRVGIGILGWGSALFMLKVRFGSEQAAQLREDVMSTIAREAYMSSIDLAEEKGMFKYCIPEKHAEGAFVQSLDLPERYTNKLRKTGIRNSSLLSIQPTGNTSILANVVSGGLEPIFMPEYIRTVIVNTMPDEIADVCPKWFEGAWHETEMFKSAKEGDEDILRGVSADGTVYKIDKNRGLTKEVLCQDYGVRWLSKRGEWDPEASWAVTTLNLSVKDHVEDLKGFARWVDSAMSKCIAEGTLITTDKGILPIEQLGDHLTSEEGFVVPNNEYKVIDEQGNLKTVISHYYGKEKPCKTIRFNNGFELTAADTHKLKTKDGWKRFDELQTGDKVFYRTNPLYITADYQQLPQPTFATNAKHTLFPSVLDEDFALFLGMWIADGSLTKNSISICEKNETVAELCKDLMEKLFGTHKSSIDDRWNVQTHYVHSRAISDWFKENMGHGAEYKKIPQFVLNSSTSVQRAFIEGLTLDGYIKSDNYTSKLVVFDGYAKDVAEKVTHMLSAMGIEYSLTTRRVGDNKLTYGVTAYLSDNDSIVPIEEHKRHYAVTGKTQKQTYISDETYEELISIQPKNSYGAMIRARLNKCKKQGNFIRMSFLNKCGLQYDPHLTCVTITDIEDAGYKKVFDIEVEDTHSYLVNGVVSHNTVNVPNEYPFEDFKDIYVDSYKSGNVKGVTTYRSGTMTTVLSAKEEKTAEENDEEIIKEDVKVPAQAPAMVSTIRADGKKWYLTTILDNEGNRPIAFFVHTNHYEKTATTHDAVEHLIQLARDKGIPEKWIQDTEKKIEVDNNPTKIARAISLNLRHGVLIKNVVAVLDRVEDIFVGSFLFQIRKFLATYIKDGETVEGEKCLNCGSDKVVFSEGCKKCLQCGSSKCG